MKLKLTPLSFLAVERIKSANLRQNGYHPRYSLTDLSEKTNLKNIIDEALTFRNDDVIPAIPETYEDKIINECETVTRLIDSRINSEEDRKKLHGNITANIFIKYMQAVIDSFEYPYKVSSNNAYIDGYGVEWDAVIVKKDAVNIMNLNVFEPSKAVAVIEFKTSGVFNSKKDFLYDDQNINKCPVLKKAIDSYTEISKSNKEIKFAYISLKERESEGRGFKYITETKNIIHKRLNGKNYNCYHFINTAGNKKRRYDNQYTWTQFVLSLLP